MLERTKWPLLFIAGHKVSSLAQPFSHLLMDWNFQNSEPKWSFSVCGLSFVFVFGTRSHYVGQAGLSLMHSGTVGDHHHTWLLFLYKLIIWGICYTTAGWPTRGNEELYYYFTLKILTIGEICDHTLISNYYGLCLDVPLKASWSHRWGFVSGWI